VGTVPTNAYVFTNLYTTSGCFELARTSVSSTGVLSTCWHNYSACPATTAADTSASIMWFAIW
jgi:hypothetical protein